MDILNMLFKSIVKINPEPKNEKKDVQKKEDVQKDNLTNEFYQRPVKLQCVVCSETFNVDTEHNCLLRESYQEFTIKYK
jgi:hypothetical protein